MDNDWDFLTETDAVKNAIETGGVEKCRSTLERMRDEWKNVPLNVAVIGNSGAGKSSLINAMRRLTADDKDKGAAEVDVNECTDDIRSYEHPNNPLLKFWDLPGVGTDNYPRETYLELIQVDRYDFFLLITATRFTENDTWLGREFLKLKKKYFFVRTKIALDMYNNKKAHPSTHNKEAVLTSIRESTEKRLIDKGCENVPVFLIDSYPPKQFEFDKLEHHLIEDFPSLKKTALIFSLQATSGKMIQLKVKKLRARMWGMATMSGLVAAIPVPGVSMAFDVDLVLLEADFYLTQLGLDEVSLQRYAKQTSTDYQQLQAIVDSSLGGRIIGVGGLKKLIEKLWKRAAPLVTSAVAEEFSRFIPWIGSLIAAPLSFGATYYALKLVLDKMESAALEVIHFATESIADAEQPDDDPTSAAEGQ